MSTACKQARQALWTGVGPTPAEAAHLASCTACQRAAALIPSLLAETRRRGEVTLAEPALERLRREIWRQTERRRGRGRRRVSPWRLLGFLSATAAAAAAVLLLTPGDKPAPAPHNDLASVTRQVGDVRVAGLEGAASERQLQGVLSLGHEVRTGAASRIDVVVAHDHIALLADSVAAITHAAAGATTIALRRGSVVVAAAADAKRAPLTVRAPFGSVVVHGTLFRVNTTEGGTVETQSGLVVVTFADGSQHRVAAGERFVVAGRRHESLGETLTPPWLAPPSSGVMVATSWPHKATLYLDDILVGPAPVFILMPAGPHAYRVVWPDGEQSGVVELEAGTTVRLMPENVKDRPNRPPQAGRPTPARGDCAGASAATQRAGLTPHQRAALLEKVAECLMQQGRLDGAEDVYRTIVDRHPRTPTAQNALFELGRLAEQRGDREAAYQAFERFLHQYPQAPLAMNAQFRVCGLQVAAEHFDQALACLSAYQQRFPDGDHLPEALFIAARLYKDIKHDCGAAAELFGRYRQLPGAERQEEDGGQEQAHQCLR